MQEGCGAYEVAVPGIPDEATAKGFEAEATRAGFHVLIAHGS
jgi:hypothetical protein